MAVVSIKSERGPGEPKDGSWITSEYLNRYLEKGFGVASEDFAEEYSLHPQDVSLIKSIAFELEVGRDSLMIAPFLNGLSIAFLMRALSVARVNKSPLILYSADPAVPRYYRSLSYIANRLRTSMAVVHPLVLCHSLTELSRVDHRTILVVDARYTRGWLNLNPVPWVNAAGPKIFLSLMDDYRLESLLKNIDVCYVRGAGKTGTAWPEPLRAGSTKLDNYSTGVSFVAETVPANDSVLANLERAFQTLMLRARDIPQAQMQLAQARRFNRLVQDSVIPISFFNEAAHGTGAYSIAQMLKSIRGGVALEAPPPVRGAFNRFISAADAAMQSLSTRHQPKVAWFKKFVLERTEPIAVPVSLRLEAEAFSAWKSSPTSSNCAEVVTLTRAHLRSEGYSLDVLAPGPPSDEDLAYLLGGVSSNVKVLVYPWQARHWNVLTKKASKLIEGVKPIPELEEEDQQEVEEAVDWAVPNRDPSSGEELLRREFSGVEKRTNVVLKTDAGVLEYDEDSLVPTLEVNKFVDIPAKLLHSGNTIILRTGGNLIDASRTVDELAQTNPVLAEAANEANLWREVLYTYIHSQNISYKEIHDRLFPANEVTYGAVKRWVLNQVKVGPQYDNLALLLSRIGVSKQKADEMARAVHRYRSFRFRVYGYIFYLWTRNAAKLFELDEKVMAEDEKIDAEFGLSLASLEQLITFAKIIEEPSIKETPPR